MEKLNIYSLITTAKCFELKYTEACNLGKIIIKLPSEYKVEINEFNEVLIYFNEMPSKRKIMLEQKGYAIPNKEKLESLENFVRQFQSGNMSINREILMDAYDSIKLYIKLEGGKNDS